MKRGYPNLELLEDRVRNVLTKDPQFMAFFSPEMKPRRYPDFDAYVFPQVWGSTCTGFDIASDGSPAIGGCAMTTEYTTIFHEIISNYYVVCFGNRPCYSVTDVTQAFLNDWADHRMASLSEAKERY